MLYWKFLLTPAGCCRSCTFSCRFYHCRKTSLWPLKSKYIELPLFQMLPCDGLGFKFLVSVSFLKCLSCLFPDPHILFLFLSLWWLPPWLVPPVSFYLLFNFYLSQATSLCQFVSCTCHGAGALIPPFFLVYLLLCLDFEFFLNPLGISGSFFGLTLLFWPSPALATFSLTVQNLLCLKHLHFSPNPFLMFLPLGKTKG